MIEQGLVDLLDGVGLGTFITILASVAAVGIPCFKYIKKLKQQLKNNIREEIEDEQKEEKIEEDLQTTIQKVDELDRKIDEKDHVVQEKITSISVQVQKNTEDIEKHNEILKEYFEAQSTMSQNIEKLSSNVEILVASDKETIRSVIIREHQRAMYNSEIELFVLQNLERLYKQYLEECNEKDEFVERLMNSMRELPTRQ